LRITLDSRAPFFALLLGIVTSLTAGTAAPNAATPVTDAKTASVARADAHAPFDLGEGLGYFRVHSPVDDADKLIALLAQNKPLIVDLRYPAPSAGNRWDDLSRAFAERARERAYLAVLVSNATEVPLPLIAALSHPGGILIQHEGPTNFPQGTVVVAQPAAADRRAYDALESGMPLEALITGKIEKERFDEAELVKEFEHGNANAAPPAEPDPGKPTAEKAPVLLDRVLQRAVHLHRALVALKRD
jgi:hypothetical protein